MALFVTHGHDTIVHTATRWMSLVGVQKKKLRAASESRQEPDNATGDTHHKSDEVANECGQNNE